MKTDQRLTTDVQEVLLWDPAVTASGITVTVHDGAVTLSGSVPHYMEKSAAERVAGHVLGVKHIAEELLVTLPDLHRRTDEELTQAVVETLKWNVWVPNDVKAVIADGWVTLTGLATWDFQRGAAIAALKHISGIRGILNDIEVRKGIQATSFKDAIEAVLRRNVLHDGLPPADGQAASAAGLGAAAGREEAGAASWRATGVAEIGIRS